MVGYLGMFDINQIIESGGLLLIALIVFAESGLLIGFFLPGDTLLLGAGILASQGQPPIGRLIAVVIIAAVVGDNVGYEIGKRTGKRIFNKKDSLLFRQDHVFRAEKFYNRHGGKTIIIARFTPFVRTFAPVVAGVGNMPHRRFFFFNVVGGILWGAGVPLLGYWFGSKVPHLEKYIHLVLITVVLASIGFSIFHILKDAKMRAILWQRIKSSVTKKLKSTK